MMTGTIYQGYIKDEAGNIIEGASVEVRDQDTNTVVTLWSNRATTSTKTNPTTTDANGYFFFYRTAGRYKITVSSDSYSATFNNVPIGGAQEYDIGSTTGLIPTVDDLAAVAISGDYDDLTGKPTLGTASVQNTGSGSGDIRINSDNDLRYFKIASNLSEGTASAMRANLGLGTAATTDATAYATAAQGSTADTALQPNTAITVTTIDTGQGAVECYAMDQPTRTTDGVTFADVSVDTVILAGLTVSQANTLGAATAGAGAIIYVTDETGGAVLAFSDGTDWRRVTDRAVIA